MTTVDRVRQVFLAELDRQAAALDAYKSVTVVSMQITMTHGREPEIETRIGGRRKAVEWGND